MLIFQIWSLKDKFWVKWSLFHKQQNSPVFPEGCDYNFIEILNTWMPKLASVFIRNFSFQCKNAEVKNTFLFYRFAKTSTYLRSNSFKKKFLSYLYCTGPCKKLSKKSFVGDFCSRNEHWSKIFRPFFRILRICQMNTILLLKIQWLFIEWIYLTVKEFKCQCSENNRVIIQFSRKSWAKEDIFFVVFCRATRNKLITCC